MFSIFDRVRLPAPASGRESRFRVHVLILLAAVLALPARADEPPPYKDVDFGRFVAEQRPVQPGSRTILRPSNIRFTARMMSRPEPIVVRYLFTALETMGVFPLPKVSSRMFLQGDSGPVHPVYVEDGAVTAVTEAAAADGMATFYGYHVYNYDKGPAIVISGAGPMP